MTTNVRRRRPAKPSVQYWWFQGNSVRELYDRIGASNPDSARLEVRISGDKMTLEVFREGDQSALRPTPPINDSHVCPPQCP